MKVSLVRESTIEDIRWKVNGCSEAERNTINRKYLWFPFITEKLLLYYHLLRNGYFQEVAYTVTAGKHIVNWKRWDTLMSQ